MIPAEVFLSIDFYFSWMLEKKRVESHPPVYPLVFFEVYKKFSDKTFLRFMCRHFLKYDNWVWDDLGGDKDGLSSYRHVWETGWDDNQRWDNVTRDNMLDPWIESVDFNSLISLQRKILLGISKLTGDRKAEKVLNERLRIVKKSFPKFCHREENFFYDITEKEYKYVLVKTVANFYPFLTDTISIC